MAEIKRTGIYFYEKNSLDIENLINFAKSITGVEVVWEPSELCTKDVNLISKKISANNIEQVIIAGERPGTVKDIFTRAMLIASKDPNNVLLASFKEYGISSNQELDRAKAVLYCVVHNTSFTEIAQPEDAPVNEETLVIGGGIAGIQASLEIANAQKKVYLVEKTGTIGGKMAKFDKTFPTLDCAACILTPKMVEVGQHPNIELLSYSEVKNVQGEPGNYKVTILKKARRVNEATCIACGTCAEKCPVKVPSEFDEGTALRKAIYMPFPQAVPNKYLIDPDNCTYVQKRKCGVCAKVCPVQGCINLDEQDKEIQITVGNIIVAIGYKVFDAKRVERLGYGKYPNVLTSLEIERLLNAAGPTGGEIKFRTKDKKGNWIFSQESDTPTSIAIIHCVGSRDENYNKYCSRVCCMYSLKFSHLIKEKLPEADIYEYFIDMRAFGKNYEEFYERIKTEGINIIRGRTAKIEQTKNGKLLLRTEDILNDQLIEKEFDMAILSVGLQPADDAEQLSKMLNIPRTEDGWFMEANSNSAPMDTFTGGITIAGVCQGPKDIPDAVAQGAAAASRVLQSIALAKIKKSLKDISLADIENKIKSLS